MELVESLRVLCSDDSVWLKYKALRVQQLEDVFAKLMPEVMITLPLYCLAVLTAIVIVSTAAAAFVVLIPLFLLLLLLLLLLHLILLLLLLYLLPLFMMMMVMMVMELKAVKHSLVIEISM